MLRRLRMQCREDVSLQFVIGRHHFVVAARNLCTETMDDGLHFAFVRRGPAKCAVDGGAEMREEGRKLRGRQSLLVYGGGGVSV